MQDATEIVVAASGDISIAPFGTTLPEDPTEDLDPAFVVLGYATEDGVTLTDGVTVQEINAWQKAQPVRKITTLRTKTAAFQLEQWNRENFELAYQGGEWTEPSPGVYRYDPPADSDDLPEWSVVIDWQDGDKHHRLVIERAIVQEGVSTKLARTGAAVLPITLGALTPDNEPSAWYHLTDDPAFAHGS